MESLGVMESPGAQHWEAGLPRKRLWAGDKINQSYKDTKQRVQSIQFWGTTTWQDPSRGLTSKGSILPQCYFSGFFLGLFIFF